MAKKNEDRFANIVSAYAAESAQGTLTFTEVNMGMSLASGVGILIDEILWDFGVGIYNLVVAESDYIEAGWFTANSSTSFSLQDNTLLSMIRFGAIVDGTPASMVPFTTPQKTMFFPPMIVASPKLYFGVQSTSVASAINARSRLSFRYIDLSTQEYLELAETFLLVG